MRLDVILKRFDAPDEVREFDKGRFEIVRLGGMTLGRATYQPGWRWSVDVGSATGGASCQVEHVGMVVSGRATAAMDDGRVVEMRAGDVFHVPPGHDSWVVGDEPYVSLHFMGADDYAAPMADHDDFGFATRAVHAGLSPNPVTGAIAPDISVAANYACKWGEIGFSAEGTDDSAITFAYQREGHPNGRQLERRLASLEGGEDAVVFASGVAAISGLVLHLLGPGDHLVVSDISYAGTAEFVRGLLRGKGVEVTLADMSDPGHVAAQLRRGAKAVYAETPCNPILKLVDVAAIARLAHGVSAKLIVDSTFATPALTRPLSLGADYVVHSLTKYIGGHGDALGGAVIGARIDMESLRRQIGTHLGATLSPFNAWLIMRGLETLPIRMAAYASSALRIAEFLYAHPFVTSVRYPGLPSHPQHALALKQMKTGGGMIAFTVKDSEAFGRAFAGHLKIFKLAASLGHSHSLILYCDTADLQRTTFQLDDELLARYRALAGDGFFRLSIGLETTEDLIADLAAALDAAAKDFGDAVGTRPA